MVKKSGSADQLIAVILKGIEEVKGKDIDILDLREIENTVCDYFIICNGSSNTQVNAIDKFHPKNCKQRNQRQTLAC